MNTYKITINGALQSSAEVEAVNIHTAVKKALYPVGVCAARTHPKLKRGETITFHVERM